MSIRIIEADPFRLLRIAGMLVILAAYCLASYWDEQDNHRLEQQKQFKHTFDCHTDMECEAEERRIKSI